MRSITLAHRPGGPALAGAAGAAALFGILIARSPMLAAFAIGALAVGIGVIWFGVVAAVVCGFAALPWLVIFEGVLPAELGTFTAALATAALLLYLYPLTFRSALVPVAACAFLLIVLGHAIFAMDTAQAIQAAKYMVFPVMAIAVSSDQARELMPSLKAPVLGSCIAAMAVHLGVIAAGLGASSTYYGAGEKLGYAANGPHALALMSMIVAGAGLTTKRLRSRALIFALGALPAALTGVRSAMLGITVLFFIYLVQTDDKRSALAFLAAIVAVALSTGALSVVLDRVVAHPGEFSSFSKVGSGRGEIWTVALNAWGSGGPSAWLFGTGLRSIVGFELAALGTELIGHSDIVEVLVQIGFFGFIAWLAVWVGVLSARLRALVIIPIVVFGAVNGTLEYVAPLMAGLFLAAVCIDRPRDTIDTTPAASIASRVSLTPART